MTKKIITTYTEYDEDGKIKSQSVTETPYPEDDCDLDCECCDCAESDEYDRCFAPALLSLLKTLELMGSGNCFRQTWTHLVTRRRLKNEQSR